jgi:hypothetical protein
VLEWNKNAWEASKLVCAGLGSEIRFLSISNIALCVSRLHAFQGRLLLFYCQEPSGYVIVYRFCNDRPDFLCV